MKKLMMIAAMMLMSMGAFAQEAGQKAVGVTLTDLLDSNSRIALGAKFQYSFTDNMRGEFDFKFYPTKYDVLVWNPTVNFHYIIPIFDKFNVYPLAGVGVWGISVKGEHSATETLFTFKAGAGCEYFITEKFKGLFEAYYQFAKKDDYKYTDPLVSLGVAYCF